MRPIDADFVTHAAELEFSEDDAANVRWLISHIPTVDAIQVIRCADCAYYGKSPFGHPHIGWCRIDCKHRKPDFYCGNADRK